MACFCGVVNIISKIITKVFLKSKILAVDTVLSTSTHTGTCTYKHTDYTKLNLKRVANRLETGEDGSSVVVK